MVGDKRKWGRKVIKVIYLNISRWLMWWVEGRFNWKQSHPLSDKDGLFLLWLQVGSVKHLTYKINRWTHPSRYKQLSNKTTSNKLTSYNPQSMNHLQKNLYSQFIISQRRHQQDKVNEWYQATQRAYYRLTIIKSKLRRCCWDFHDSWYIGYLMRM